MLNRRAWALLFVVCLPLSLATPASAHTQIVETEPEEGGRLGRAPEQVKLFFEGPVEAEFSPLGVHNEQGERVDLDNVRVDTDDLTVMVVDLREDLPAGSYTVEYRYTGVDGHVINGSYGFNVSRASADDAPKAAQTNVQSASAGEEAGSFSSASVYVTLALAALTLLGLAVVRRH